MTITCLKARHDEARGESETGDKDTKHTGSSHTEGWKKLRVTIAILVSSVVTFASMLRTSRSLFSELTMLTYHAVMFAICS